mmetsp:Transcript_76519/g.127472  ORF Transcript_76519/g.127472 Transcript_76519/m.127472 type:complete len:119 (+) Transcript_76519:501-857(+)
MGACLHAADELCPQATGRRQEKGHATVCDKGHLWWCRVDALECAGALAKAPACANGEAPMSPVPAVCLSSVQKNMERRGGALHDAACGAPCNEPAVASVMPDNGNTCMGHFGMQRWQY